MKTPDTTLEKLVTPPAKMPTTGAGILTTKRNLAFRASLIASVKAQEGRGAR
jgi:hypothetical protein